MSKFVEKLRTMNLDRYNDNGDLSNERGWSIKTAYKMHAEDGLFPSVQVIVTVYFQGARAGNWGCMREDQSEIVLEILNARNRADSREIDIKVDAEDVAENMWKNWIG
jgi:hypothetical protein